MLIRTELAALRSDDAPQRRAQRALVDAVQQWRDGPACPGLAADLASYALGAALTDLRLARLFDPADLAAARLTQSLMAVLTRQLEAGPLGQVPLRHQSDGTQATLVVARHGTAALLLQATGRPGLARLRPAVSARFTPGDVRERVLAGSAAARLVTLDRERPGGAELTVTDCPLAPGAVICRSGARQTLLVDSPDGLLVTLKLQRRPASGGLTRAFDLASGSFIHQAAAAARDSRLELTAALLGRMGRTDAAPMLAAMAEEQADPSLRWQSLKECLGLDSGAGFAALTRIAACSSDPLAMPAGALRAQLLERYPQLAEAASCRA